MKVVPYASVIESLMYTMICTRPNIFYALDMVSKYQFNPGSGHWTVVKHIFKYLRRIRDYMFTYEGSNLILVGYTSSDFMLDMDSRKSTSAYVFTLGEAAIS